MDTIPSVEIIKTQDKIDLDKKIQEATILSPIESKEIIKQIECLDGEQFDINQNRCLPCSHYQLVWDSESKLCKPMLKDQIFKEKEILSSNMVLKGLDIVVNDKKNIIGYIEKDDQEGGFDKNNTKFPRKMSKEYCMKTPCKHMGFSQKASCRYYKNCYE